MSNRVSIAAFGCVLILCLFTMSQSSGPSIFTTPLRVEYVPHPRDYVQIKESTPFTVPAGKVLAMTALGVWSLTVNDTVTLSADGVDEYQTFVSVSSIGSLGTPMLDVSPGLTFPAGTVLTVRDGLSVPVNGRAWGYLAAQ